MVRVAAHARAASAQRGPAQAIARAWFGFRNRAAPWVGLFAIPLLGKLLSETLGSFAPWAVMALLSAAVVWTLIGVGAESRIEPSWLWRMSVYAVFAAELVVIAEKPQVVYALPSLRKTVWGHGLWVIVAAALILVLLHVLSRGAWTKHAHWFWGFVFLLFLARIAVMPLSPNPYIDVFTSGTLGAHYFWSGLNPYAQTYPDIYYGRYDYVPTFFYGPTYVIFSALAFVLADVRWTTIVAEAVTVGAVLAFARAHALRPVGQALVLVWLAFPVCLFILEQAWVDPIVLAAVAWTLHACWRGRYTRAGLAMGIALGVKQPSVLMAALTFAWIFRVSGLRGASRYVLGGAITAGATFVPFLLWNAEAMWKSLVVYIMGHSPRMDALSLSALFNHLQIPVTRSVLTTVSTCTCLALGVWLLLRARALSDLTSAAVLAYLVVYLCGYVAFCNYYWFVGGLWFLDLLVRLVTSRDVVQPAPRERALAAGRFALAEAGSP